MRIHKIPSCYRKSKRSLLCLLTWRYYLTLNGSKYPCLELIFMVSKVFEPLKFDCTLIYHDSLKYQCPRYGVLTVSVLYFIHYIHHLRLIQWFIYDRTDSTNSVSKYRYQVSKTDEAMSSLR